MEARFWPRVDKRGPDECWLWTGGKSNNTGYGTVGAGGYGKGSVSAHRASYELHNGPIPKGMVIMHTCDNRLCVNPNHLKMGTHKENTQDMMRKGRHRFQTPRGETSSLSKLTEAHVRFIRKYNDIPTTELAEVFGVKSCAVWRIRTGRTWAHIK